jgi:hypothetical protein
MNARAQLRTAARDSNPMFKALDAAKSLQQKLGSNARVTLRRTPGFFLEVSSSSIAIGDLEAQHLGVPVVWVRS